MDSKHIIDSWRGGAKHYPSGPGGKRLLRNTPLASSVNSWPIAPTTWELQRTSYNRCGKWGTTLKFVDVGDGLFHFRFSLESQLWWVSDNRPWSFENNMMVVQRWEKGLTTRTVQFRSMLMWVQVWGLPLDLIDEEAGLDIGRGIGSVVEVDGKALASN